MSTQSSTPNEDVQRWTAKRKAAVVLDLIKGKTTCAEVCPRPHCGGSRAVRDDFISLGSEALRSHPRDATQFGAREQQLLAKVGELTLAVDILRKAHRILGKDLPEGIS